MSNLSACSGGWPGTIPASAGIGLRFPHHRDVIETRPAVGWLEVHTENYTGGGNPAACLEAVRADYPLSLHGVGMSLGSADGLDADHLARVRDAVRRFEPALVSDHLSWSLGDGLYVADLLPLPLTEEALAVVCRNVERFQDGLGRQILVENPSSYLRYRHSTIPEAEFLGAVVAATGCGLLCDVNNIFVSACNHGWDAMHYLDTIPAAAVQEIHLAGHAIRTINGRDIRIDDHGSAVSDPVWTLFSAAIQRFGRIPTLIEWDNNLPALDILVAEAAKADAILAAAPQHTSERERHAAFA
ncbi:MAG: DUF692 domain-containing protein [Azospirillaceae bacterium]|nr:DUF692 domain-containing protein [Azospirillaceae bacterium]